MDKDAIEGGDHASISDVHPRSPPSLDRGLTNLVEGRMQDFDSTPIIEGRRKLRMTFHSPPAIDYRAPPDALVIIRVIHEARDLAALAKRGGFE